MRGFRFRLQPVLDLREEQEQRLAAALGEAAASAREADAQHERLLAQRASGAAWVQSVRAEGGAVGAMLNAEVVLDSLQRHIQASEAARAQAHQRLAEAQEAYAAGARERQVLDQLRERKHEEWRREESQRERVRMDDVARNLFLRPVLLAGAEGE